MIDSGGEWEVGCRRNVEYTVALLIGQGGVHCSF